MIFTSLGDLAQRMVTNRLSSDLRSDLVRLTTELATGETSAPAEHLSADFRYLSSVEHRKRTAEAYESAASEASSFATAMQTAMDRVQSSSQALSTDLLVAQEGPDEGRQAVVTAAEQSLAEIVSALNTSFAGRSLFAGNATDGPAVASAEDLLNAVRETLTGETTADGILAAVSGFFDSADGFQDQIYLGAKDPLSPFHLGENESVQLSMRADAQEVRDVLAATVLAAVSADYSAELRRSLQEASGLALIEGQSDLTELRADIGFAEARIEEIGVAIAAERTALDFARESLLGVDEYETATRLENTQFQIEALYTVTARLSGLSLLGYLR